MVQVGNIQVGIALACRDKRQVAIGAQRANAPNFSSRYRKTLMLFCFWFHLQRVAKTNDESVHVCFAYYLTPRRILNSEVRTHTHVHKHF